MQTIILGGYSTKNKEWAMEVAKNIPNSKIYDWKHWIDPTIKFSAKDEAQNLESRAEDSKVNIIAKSIGTLVTSIFLKNNLQSVNKIILCGVPVNDIADSERGEYRTLGDIKPENITVFQNSEDEHGNFEEVRKFLSQINPHIKIVEKSGKTHDYPYYENFKEFLNNG